MYILKELFFTRRIINSLLILIGIIAWCIIDIQYSLFALSSIDYGIRMTVSVFTATVLTGARLFFVWNEINAASEGKKSIAMWSKVMLFALMVYTCFATANVARIFAKDDNAYNALLIIFEGLNVLIFVLEVFLVNSFSLSTKMSNVTDQVKYNDLMDKHQNMCTKHAELLQFAQMIQKQLENAKYELEKANGELYKIRLGNGPKKVETKPEPSNPSTDLLSQFSANGDGVKK
jgi:hypothetical protein